VASRGEALRSPREGVQLKRAARAGALGRAAATVRQLALGERTRELEQGRRDLGLPASHHDALRGLGPHGSQLAPDGLAEPRHELGGAEGLPDALDLLECLAGLVLRPGGRVRLELGLPSRASAFELGPSLGQPAGAPRAARVRPEPVLLLRLGAAGPLQLPEAPRRSPGLELVRLALGPARPGRAALSTARATASRTSFLAPSCVTFASAGCSARAAVSVLVTLCSRPTSRRAPSGPAPPCSWSTTKPTMRCKIPASMSTIGPRGWWPALKVASAS